MVTLDAAAIRRIGSNCSGHARAGLNPRRVLRAHNVGWHKAVGCRREESIEQLRGFPARVDLKATGDQNHGAAVVGLRQLRNQRAELLEKPRNEIPLRFRELSCPFRNAEQPGSALDAHGAVAARQIAGGANVIQFAPESFHARRDPAQLTVEVDLLKSLAVQSGQHVGWVGRNVAHHLRGNSQGDHHILRIARALLLEELYQRLARRRQIQKGSVKRIDNDHVGAARLGWRRRRGKCRCRRRPCGINLRGVRRRQAGAFHAERRDLLLHAIFEHLEIRLLEAGHAVSLRIGDHHGNQHLPHIYLDRGP